jgi:hypothetical protein
LVAEAITGLLGGTAHESSFTSGKDGLPHPVVHIAVVWRDVAVQIAVGGSVPIAAPVSLPSAWTAAAVSA